MKKTIYLHIGTHKTGTTTLQNYLYINSDLLKKRNYDYLKGNCTWKAHHALGWSFQGAGKPIEKYCAWRDLGVINYLEYEINNSNCNNFIISSENLYQLKDLIFIQRFFDRFNKYEFKVIVYFRDQVSFIESWYSELIRADYYKLNESIETFIKEPRYNLDYYSELKKWEKFVPRNDIYTLNFMGESRNGKLINSFCNIIGLQDYEKFIVPDNKNEKVNYKQLELLKELNSKNITHKIWIKERDYILDNYQTDSKEKVSLLSDALKNKIIEGYRGSNKLLKKHFNIDL